MWEAIKDYTFLILGTLFATIELIRGFKNKKSNLWLIILIILIVIFVGLGIDQINRNNVEKRTAKEQSLSLNGKIENLEKSRRIDSLQRITDSSRDAEFQDKLFKEFKITRDSINNKPVLDKYNTKIDKARDVYIGPRN